MDAKGGIKGAVAIHVNESDMIREMKKQSDSDYDVKCASVQFYDKSYNSQSNNWIRLQFYMTSPPKFSYRGLKFQVNPIIGLRIMTVVVKLDTCAFYVRIRI
jgi:hypothetical protein